jgi:hypothetical protein
MPTAPIFGPRGRELFKIEVCEILQNRYIKSPSDRRIDFASMIDLGCTPSNYRSRMAEQRCEVAGLTAHDSRVGAVRRPPELASLFGGRGS